MWPIDQGQEKLKAVNVIGFDPSVPHVDGYSLPQAATILNPIKATKAKTGY